MKKIKETDYLFSTARVRSVEKYMLSREKAEKMIDAKTNDDALRILFECNYNSGKVNDKISPNDYDSLLSQEHKRTYEFITSIAPEEESFNIFLYPYDYHNLKVLMKSEYLDIDSSELLVDTGSIDLNTLKYAIKERDFSNLSENMSSAVSYIIEEFPKNKDPQLIDIILDKYLYDEMLKSSKKINNKFINDYIVMQIDIINLKTYVRLKKMNKSWDFFTKVFIEGGKIPEQFFIKYYDETFEDFGDELFVYGYKETFLEGIEGLNESGKFTTLEKLFDNKIMEHVKSAKYISYGIEPLVAYLIAKENEIKIARIIMAGRLAGIPSELIRERMRETYV
ncbi:MAG: V-type ATP synthase subunit C [Tissierellia bacterium]|nr:V-type ATP synthase subunit C [Tissierellia bacterium]